MSLTQPTRLKVIIATYQKIVDGYTVYQPSQDKLIAMLTARERANSASRMCPAFLFYKLQQKHNSAQLGRLTNSTFGLIKRVLWQTRGENLQIERSMNRYLC